MISHLFTGFCYFMVAADEKNIKTYLAKLPELKAKLSKEELHDVEKFLLISQSLQLESFDGEIWVDFRNTNGLYSISNYCRIRRNSRTPWICKRGKLRTGEPPKIIRQRSQKGYRSTMISVNNIQKSFRLHRELAFHFIDNKYNKPFINHKNGIRDDNRIINLEWCDNSVNQKHSFKENGRQPVRAMLGKRGYDCKNSKPIIQCDMNGTELKEWGGASEAARQLGMLQSCISAACNNKTKSSGGFKWKYKNKYDTST